MKRLLLILFLVLYPFAFSHAATITDEFARADNIDVGTNWDHGYDTLAACQIVSGRVRNQAPVETCVETWNANSFTDNQWVQATLATFNSASTSQIAVLLRAAAPTTFTYYRIVARRNFGTATTRIQKFIAGASTTLAFENAITWLAGDVIYAEVNGTTITAKRNGVTVLTATDSDLTAGRIGLNLTVDEATSTTEIESFTGGDLTTATHRRVGAMVFQ